jgi:hypothetical protein
MVIGLAVHPARPLLAELVVGHPPFAGVGGAITAEKLAATVFILPDMRT